MKTSMKRVLLFAVMLFTTLMIAGTVSAATLNRESLTIEKGQTYKLKVTDGTATNWTSSDTSIATVSSSGKVTAKRKGTTYIKCNVGWSTLQCMVTVVNKSTSSSRRYTVLILDGSGSMYGTPIQKQKEAAKEFCNKLLKAKGDDYIAIIAFDSSYTLLNGFTTDYSTLADSIDKSYRGGGTNYTGPLTQAEKLLDGVTNATLKNVVICSDGRPFDATSAYTVDDRIKAKKNTWVYSLGFFHSLSGSTLDSAKAVMKRLASRESSSIIITDVKDISIALKKIANEIISYKLTLNANGGTVSKKTVKAESGKAWGTLPTPKRSGYTFDGWYTAKTGGTKITSTTKATASIKVYAHWTASQTQKYTLSGIVKDAKTGEVLKQATLKLRKGKNKKTGTVYASTKSDSNGKYSLKVEKGTFTLAVEKKNYITTYHNINVEKDTKENVTITTKIASTQYRIVLTWGGTPDDLDAMLTGPTDSGSRFWIYWSNKTATYGGKTLATLDVDDRNGYGPETVTLNLSVLSNGKFCYYVHNYTDRNSSSTNTLAQSGAKVEVYRGSSLVATYYVPNKAGRLWHVFDINNGNIVKQNVVNYENSIE